jgi:thymidylate synthase
VLRSNDLFLGLPHNFIQFTYLQEILAGWLGLDVGKYFQLSDSLHVYAHDLDKIGRPMKLEGVPVNTDSLAFPRDESEDAFRRLSSDVDLMIDERNRPNSVARLVSESTLLPEFRNLLSLLAAEALRRRGEPEMAIDMMTECSNDVLRWLWKNWNERVTRKTNTT